MCQTCDAAAATAVPTPPAPARRTVRCRRSQPPARSQRADRCGEAHGGPTRRHHRPAPSAHPERFAVADAQSTATSNLANGLPASACQDQPWSAPATMDPLSCPASACPWSRPPPALVAMLTPAGRLAAGLAAGQGRRSPMSRAERHRASCGGRVRWQVSRARSALLRPQCRGRRRGSGGVRGGRALGRRMGLVGRSPDDPSHPAQGSGCHHLSAGVALRPVKDLLLRGIRKQLWWYVDACITAAWLAG